MNLIPKTEATLPRGSRNIEADLRRCIQCDGRYGSEFFYSNGRGGMRPRCIGCMMTRRHNQKRKLLGLPPYSEAAPFMPLRKSRARPAAINMRRAPEKP